MRRPPLLYPAPPLAAAWRQLLGQSPPVRLPERAGERRGGRDGALPCLLASQGRPPRPPASCRPPGCPGPASARPGEGFARGLPAAPRCRTSAKAAAPPRRGLAVASPLPRGGSEVSRAPALARRGDAGTVRVRRCRSSRRLLCRRWGPRLAGAGWQGRSAFVRAGSCFQPLSRPRGGSERGWAEALVALSKVSRNRLCFPVLLEPQDASSVPR